MFADDVLASYELSESCQHRELTPERELILAMLRDALSVAMSEAVTSESATRKAQQWIRSDDRTWPFSFLNTCEHLDIDPSYLRRLLAARMPSSISPLPLP